MTIWTAEIKELDNLKESFEGHLPEIEKELEQLIKTQDPNVVMLYSRRCLEVIITDLCECELKRPRKTEPLKGIIDKLNSEEKVSSHIITSMLGVNSLSNYGAHPKDFDPEQVKPVLSNLSVVLKWYLKYKDFNPGSNPQEVEKTNKSKVIEVSIIEKSIAVLPFKNDSADEENTYFINGIMEEILTNLQMIRAIRVLSRTSVEQYRQQTKSIPEIAKELGVNYVVEGSAQKYGNLFRLRVQLIMAAKESHLWAKSYQQEILEVKDIFNIQSQIAEAIAEELNAAITPQEKRMIEKMPTTDMEAYEAYIIGRHNWRKFTPGDLEIAMKYFELAKEKDNDFALAYLGISDVWYGLLQLGIIPPSESDPVGKFTSALTKALELDSTLAEVHYSLGNMYGSFNWDWKASEEEYEKALKINPNYSDVYAAQSNLFAGLGRKEEAIETIQTALKLDPQNIFNKVLYGATMMFTRRYDDAIASVQDVLKIDPNNFLAKNILPIVFHMNKKYTEGLNSWKSFVISFYNIDQIDYDQIFIYNQTKEGYSGILNNLADKLTDHLQTTQFDVFNIAIIYACAGNKEKASDMLERAYENHNPNTGYLLNPVFDILKAEPRYIELCQKMKLPLLD